jgi:hypothetical protein
MVKGRKMITPTLLALFATVAGAFAVWWASKEQDAYNDKLLKAQEKLFVAQNEITRLNEDIRQSVTGGHGFCVVNFFSNSSGTIDVDIISESEYPLYDVEVEIRPWYPQSDFKLEKALQELNSKLKKAYKKYTFKAGTVAARRGQLVTSKKIGELPTGPFKRWFYTVDFTARNGEWRQVWDFMVDQNGEPIGSHIVYKTEIVKNTIRKIIIAPKVPDPRYKNSIINSLIMEDEYSSDLPRTIIRREDNS